MNILFTCAGRRRYLLKYFKEVIGNSGKIFATDMQLSAPALTAADVKIQVPGVYAENYIETILSICQKNQIDVLISLNDLELPILSRRKAVFEVLGTKVIVSDPNVIDICFDKYKTAQYIDPRLELVVLPLGFKEDAHVHAQDHFRTGGLGHSDCQVRRDKQCLPHRRYQEPLRRSRPELQQIGRAHV